MISVKQKLNQSFESFAENLPFYGHLILNLDDMNIRKIEKNIHRKNISFGFTDINQYQIIKVELMQTTTSQAHLYQCLHRKEVRFGHLFF